MALDAVNRGMRSGERERGVVVVKRRSGPCSCGVARVAGGREACGCMIGVCGAVPVSLVAAVTRSRQRCVVVVGVALRAGDRRMRTCQREPRVVVIERRRAPTTRRMADRAVGREARRYVVRIRCAAVVGLVARVTSRGCVGVVVVRVALRAGQRRMHARQRIIRVLRVVEVDVCPIRCGVARVARGWEASRSVVGIRRAVPIRLMATEARCGQSRVVVISVALRAGDRGVRARQWENR